MTHRKTQLDVFLRAWIHPEINISTGRERIWMVANGNGSLVIRSGD